MRRLAALAAAGALALAGCGGDEEPGITDGTPVTREDSTATTETAPPATETETEATETEPPTATGEDQPGGAGDEAENTIPADITGRGGKVAPARISVAPFIRLSITLRSGDGEVYELRGGGNTFQVGGPSGEDAVTVVRNGLRPGRSIALSGPQGSVRIVANAEPGP